MKRILLLLIAVVLLLGAFVLLILNGITSQTSISTPALISSTTSGVFEVQSIHWPIDRAEARVTKKPFGLNVRPERSPVSPERFSGYHTGVDFEVFSDEVDQPVEIRAICTGTLLVKRVAAGYGGLVVQACEFNDQPVTVVYGHLKLISVQTKVGDEVRQGQPLAVLGAGGSMETDGERTHLHLGIHKGTAIDIRGYVSSVAELDQWLDVRTLSVLQPKP